MFADSPVLQQSMAACKPFMEPLWVVFIFMAAAVLLVPIGAVCTAYSMRAVEVSSEYDENCWQNLKTNEERQQFQWQVVPCLHSGWWCRRQSLQRLVLCSCVTSCWGISTGWDCTSSLLCSRLGACLRTLLSSQHSSSPHARCRAARLRLGCAQNAANDAALTCTTAVRLLIEEDMDAPVYMFYEIDKMHQNHLRCARLPLHPVPVLMSLPGSQHTGPLCQTRATCPARLISA